MKLLFGELAKNLRFTEERVQKFRKWIVNASKARDETSLEKGLNQYDKAEELITFYSFAPLGLREDKKGLLHKILAMAGVHQIIEKDVKIKFEKLYAPPKEYLSWFSSKASNHPVRYVREQAKEHIKENKDLETETHVDAVIDAENVVIFIETKFTSDISVQTTFNANRNQLARLIDVGIEVAKKDNKKLVVLVCSPEEFFDRKSRLFYYKIREYSDYREVKKDIEWRPQEEIEKYLLKVAWVPLEEVIRILYTGFSHSDKAEALAFFEERKLSKPDILF
jgi:hypothetical protein